MNNADDESYEVASQGLRFWRREILSLEPVLVALVISKAYLAREEHEFPLHVRRQSRLQKPPRCSRLQQLENTGETRT